MHMSRNKILILKSTPRFTFVLPCYENSYPYAPLHPICFDIPDPRASLSVRDYLRVHLKTQSRLVHQGSKYNWNFIVFFVQQLFKNKKRRAAWLTTKAYRKSFEKKVRLLIFLFDDFLLRIFIVNFLRVKLNLI